MLFTAADIDTAKAADAIESWQGFAADLEVIRDRHPDLPRLHAAYETAILRAARRLVCHKTVAELVAAFLNMPCTGDPVVDEITEQERRYFDVAGTLLRASVVGQVAFLRRYQELELQAPQLPESLMILRIWELSAGIIDLALAEPTETAARDTHLKFFRDSVTLDELLADYRRMLRASFDGLELLPIRAAYHARLLEIEAGEHMPDLIDAVRGMEGAVSDAKVSRWAKVLLVVADSATGMRPTVEVRCVDARDKRLVCILPPEQFSLLAHAAHIAEHQVTQALAVWLAAHPDKQ